MLKNVCSNLQNKWGGIVDIVVRVTLAIPRGSSHLVGYIKLPAESSCPDYFGFRIYSLNVEGTRLGLILEHRRYVFFYGEFVQSPDRSSLTNEHALFLIAMLQGVLGWCIEYRFGSIQQLVMISEGYQWHDDGTSGTGVERVVHHETLDVTLNLSPEELDCYAVARSVLFSQHS